MNPEAKQASLVVDSVAKAVGTWVVDRHAEVSPHLPSRYGGSWRSDWIGHTTSQVHMLAQSVAVRSPQVFAHYLHWTCESFRVRGVDEADFLQNTKFLHDVLAEELPPPVSKIAVEFVDAGIAALAQPNSSSTGEPAADAPLQAVVLEYLEAILEGDRARAEERVIAAVERGTSLSDIYESVLAPAQARLGRMWHRGEISIADEHVGSSITQAVMARLRPRFEPAEPNGRIVVATSTPGDLHEIGLRMVADLFELDGWGVVYLGANTPSRDVVELLGRRSADLLALSVSTALTLRDAGELIEQVRSDSKLDTVKILVGGPPFREVEGLWQELGAGGFATSARSAIQEARGLVLNT